MMQARGMPGIIDVRPKCSMQQEREGMHPPTCMLSTQAEERPSSRSSAASQASWATVSPEEASLQQGREN